MSREANEAGHLSRSRALAESGQQRVGPATGIKFSRDVTDFIRIETGEGQRRTVTLS
ncbi:hypothetical protein [Spirosoma agri]|uniref:Uncharacterized protein n=1 Tax=Spirosoma agri TaxID=1987381 RepID=A0A6M0IIH9_9BACT|nr:hypothetical protein [Spirosoma agri]NEU67642.1 hypothetical protein [Spirosoma agri]